MRLKSFWKVDDSLINMNVVVEGIHSEPHFFIDTAMDEQVLPELAKWLEGNKLSIKRYPTKLRKALKPLMKQIRQAKKEFFNSLAEEKRK